jgi:hypothetical protein
MTDLNDMLESHVSNGAVPGAVGLQSPSPPRRS